jgi:hypothetical protein
MRELMSRRAAILLLPVVAGLVALGVGRSVNAQTMEPYIWGISNQGETCSGYCYSGPRGGQYICCGIHTKPAPNP